MSVNDRIHSEEGWKISNLCQLWKSERTDYTGLVRNTVYEQMYLLAGRHYGLFNFNGKQGTFPGRACWAVTLQNSIRLPPWLILLHTNAIWTQDRLRDVLARDGHLNAEGKIAICLGLFKLYRIVLANARQSSRACSTSIDATEPRWCDA